jgi:hypothetical protein
VHPSSRLVKLVMKLLHLGPLLPTAHYDLQLFPECPGEKLVTKVLHLSPLSPSQLTMTANTS